MQQNDLNDFNLAKSTVKIKDAQIVEIAKALEKGMLILGIKGNNLPDQFTMQYMVTELRTQYYGLCIGELLLAFQLASRSKLDYQEETYQNFSVLYLNRMVSAYHRWAIKQVNAMPEEKKSLPYEKVTEDNIVNMALENYKKFRNRMQIFMGLSAFDILKDKLIEKYDPKTVVEKTENYLKDQIIDRTTKKEIQGILSDDDLMEYACRRIALSLYFDELINEENAR